MRSSFEAQRAAQTSDRLTIQTDEAARRSFEAQRAAQTSDRLTIQTDEAARRSFEAQRARRAARSIARLHYYKRAR